MITLITTLLIIYFSTDHQVFMVPHIEKIVKAEAADPVRRKAADKCFKEAKKEIKHYNKQSGKIRKEISKIQSDRLVTRQELENLYKKNTTRRTSLHEFVVDKRIELSHLLTQEEWDTVVAKAIIKLEDKRAKRIRKDEKSQKKAKDDLDHIQEKIAQRIEKNPSKDLLMESFEMLEKRTVVLMNVADSLRFDNNPVLQDQSSNRETLLEVYKQVDQARDKTFETLLDARDMIIENATEKEWKAISKTLEELFGG